jgi:hypothetical protein
MKKRTFLFILLAFVGSAATVVRGQMTIDSRQILQQYQMALSGQLDQPIKCGFPAIALLHAEPPTDPELAGLLKASLQRPQLDRFYITPSGRFRIHYTLSGADAVDPTSTNGQNVPDFVYEAGQAADWSYHILVDSLGFAPHADDEGVDGSEFDFYIQALDDRYGETRWDWRAQQTRGPAYIVFDNDFTGFYTEGLEGLRVTVAHEYFHAVQLNIRLRSDDIFFFEISSVWFEDFAYDDIGDYLQYLTRWFNDLSVPLSRADGWHEYGSALWLHYLVKRLGHQRPVPKNNIVYRLWQEIAQQPAINAFGTVLKSSPSFTEALQEFYEWSFFTGTRADPIRYFEEGETYPQIKLQQISFDVKNDTTVSGSLLALAANLRGLVRTGQHLELDLQAATGGPWRVTAIAYDKQQGYFFRRGGQSTISVEAPAGEDTLVVAVINAGLQLNSASSPYSLQVRFVSQQQLVNLLEKPWPNPLRPRHDKIYFPLRLQKRTDVEAVILREDGKVIYNFRRRSLGAGTHDGTDIVDFFWDGRNESGERVASGVYFFRLIANDFHETTKFVIVN